MKIPELAFFILFGLVVSYISGWAIRDRVKKKRIIDSLRRRPQQDDNQFRQSFSPGDSSRGELALRVRKVLAKNLELPLGGLLPEDKLDADLGAELAGNPNLFWELEEEFGIQTDAEDYETHEKSIKSLVTFRDLVDYVAARIEHRPPQ